MKLGHAQKAKFQISLLPLFLLFLPHFLAFAGHSVGFILVEKVFRKAVKILELDERKGKWVVEQDFRGNFGSTLHGFLPFPLVPLTELC